MRKIVRSLQVVQGYVLAVSAAGLALFVAQVPSGLGNLVRAPGTFGLLALFVLTGQLLPIGVPRHREAEYITVSSAFAFATLLDLGVGAGVLALGAASAVADVLQRKPPWKVAFNLGQYSLSLGLAGGLYVALGGDGRLAPGQTGVIAATSIGFFILNHTLVGVGIALARGAHPLAALREDLSLQAWTSVLLLGMSPIVVVVIQRSLLLVPILALPLAAVYLVCKEAARADERRAEAEHVAAAARAAAAEQARLMEAEKLLVQELQDNERRKADLLAMVSHELRTPLTSVLGTLSTLQVHGARLGPETHAELLTIGMRQGQRLQRLIEQLLLASRFEDLHDNRAGWPEVDGVDLLHQVAVEAQRRHPNRHIIVAAPKSMLLRTDPNAVVQVLDNLLDNACKYSPDGEIIRLLAEVEGTLAVIAVEDYGPGVPPSDRERIFQRFTQLEGGATRRAGGVGLGLYIARQAARAHGGDLVVGEAKTTTGGRFELRLPLTVQTTTLTAVSPSAAPSSRGTAAQGASFST